MITTTHGDMDEAGLKRYEPPVVDNENEFTTAVEYWMDVTGYPPCPEGHDIRMDGIVNGETRTFERVHRSAHVTLKRMPAMGAEAGGFG